MRLPTELCGHLVPHRAGVHWEPLVGHLGCQFCGARTWLVEIGSPRYDRWARIHLDPFVMVVVGRWAPCNRPPDLTPPDRRVQF